MIQTLVNGRRHFTIRANGVPKYAVMRGVERGARNARASEALNWVCAGDFNARRLENDAGATGGRPLRLT
jgi:hypothetical protein